MSFTDSIRIMFVLVVVFGVPAYPQPWSGILDPTRAINWNTSNPGAPSINEARAQCGTTLTPSGGDDASAINNAIASCGAHQFVLLGSGAFSLASGLNFNGKSSVTLRGSGPLSTVLKWTSGASPANCVGINANICIAASGTAFYGSPTVQAPNGSKQSSWTAGYAQGTSTITLGNTSALSVGMQLILDQMNDQLQVTNATENGNTVTITTKSAHDLSVGSKVSLGMVGGSFVNFGTLGASESGNVVTIDTETAHGFSVGQKICLQGITVSGYNGTWTVAAIPDTTHFTYVNTVTGLANSGGGQANACYDGGPYTVTTIPTGTSFTYSASVTGLSNSTTGLVAVDTGGAFICDVAGPCISFNTPAYACRVTNGVNACQSQIVTITGINGNNVAITPSLYATNWRSSQSPGAWWPASAWITGVGIENVTLDNSLDVSAIRSVIVYTSAKDSWVKNVRSLLGNRNHIWALQGSHLTIRDSYFYGTLNSTSQSYGIEDGLVSDSLVENNIFHFITSPTIGAGGTGTVFGYNYTNTNFYSTPPTVMSSTVISHDAANTYKLYEGNDTDALWCDSFHGTTYAETLFRNRLTGFEPGKTSGTIAISLASGCRAMNVIGNVLGTASVNTLYQSTSSGTCQDFSVVYHIGWPSSFCSAVAPPSDPLVTSTFYRWGNYDTANGSTQWNSSEVPTAGVPYIGGNSVPESHVLPASFYLSAQPRFWTNKFAIIPWPAIGPDVIGGTAPDGIGGHAYSIPAELCFANTPLDTNYQANILAFDANSCLN